MLTRQLSRPFTAYVGLLFFASCLTSSFTVAQSHLAVAHVFVALADNQNQGIRLEWHLISCGSAAQPAVLERCVFYRQSPEAVLVADAYSGARIREAVSDFVSSAAALREESLPLTLNSRGVVVPLAGGADLLVYVGHEGLMDFQIARVPGKPNRRKSQFIIFACASKPYFRSYMQETQSEPLLWTAGLMAPEAYTLQAALEGWVRSESGESIRQRAAVAYDKYQKCGLRAAQRLFVTGW